VIIVQLLYFSRFHCTLLTYFV